MFTCVVAKTKADDMGLPPTLHNEACCSFCLGHFLSFVSWVIHEPLWLGIKLHVCPVAQNAQDPGTSTVFSHCLPAPLVQPLLSPLPPTPDSTNNESTRRLREIFKLYVTVFPITRAVLMSPSRCS